MKKNILINIKQKILIFFVVIFSLLINQYYGNLGVFPVDSFSHFDTGFKILLGEYPFKDYWLVSGPIVDYIQAIFFYLFGVNWQSYVFHASFFNAVLSISTFIILKNFKLNIYYCFLFSILFSILAYPSSGTPFVDHHSTFFSLLAMYSLLMAIKFEKKIYWYLLPLLFLCAFLSKQVPSSYIFFFTILILFFYSIANKKYYWIKYFLLSSLFLLILFLIIGKVQGINLSSFIKQYILYPQSIGTERLKNVSFTFDRVFSHFKFIYIALIPMLFVQTKMILLNINFLKQKDFYYFLILVIFTLSLIVHQLITKNQTFIFFLIPILSAFSIINLKKINFRFNNIIQILIVVVSIVTAFKYHDRFNEGRKFHELINADFNLASKAQKIDKKFKGLKWITPEYKNDPVKEINMINQVKSHLSNDDRKKMLITNYSFFSVILNEKIFSPSRWYLFDGTDFPLNDNEYFADYKKLLIDLIKKNSIKVIYIIHPVDNSIIYNYFNKDCLTEVKISKFLSSYELIENCN